MVECTLLLYTRCHAARVQVPMGICALFTIQLRQRVPGSEADTAVNSVALESLHDKGTWLGRFIALHPGC